MADSPSNAPSPSNSSPVGQNAAEQAPVPLTPQAVVASTVEANKNELPYYPADLTLAMASQVQLWQGQFPPPEAIERYEKVHPGAFGRMITMAEFSQKTRADDTRRAQDYAHADTRNGQFLGAITTAIAMFCAMGCVAIGAYTGKQWAFCVAAAFISVPVMAVASKLAESARAPSNKDLPALPQAPPPPQPNRPDS